MRAGAAEEALDRMFGGVVLLDERGTPIVTNRTADRILARNDGLALDWNGPSASTPWQTGELRRALAGAAKTGAGKGEDAGAVLRLARPSGRPALEVVVTPIGCESSPLFDRRATSAIFVADPDAGPRGLRSGFAGSTGSRRWRPRLPLASPRGCVLPRSARSSASPFTRSAVI